MIFGMNHILPSNEVQALSMLREEIAKAASLCDDIARHPIHNEQFTALIRCLETVEGCAREMAKFRDDTRWLGPIMPLAECAKRAQKWLTPNTVTGKKLFPILADNMRMMLAVFNDLATKRPPKLGFIDWEVLPHSRTHSRPVQVTKSGLILPAA
jgi:hypothetical protein